MTTMTGQIRFRQGRHDLAVLFRPRVSRAGTIGRIEPESFDWGTRVAYITVDKCWKCIGLGASRPHYAMGRTWMHPDTLRAESARDGQSVSRRKTRRITVNTNPIDSPESEPLAANVWQQELAAHRLRAEEILSAQSGVIDEVEKELIAQLEEISSELAQAVGGGESDRQEWRERAASLENRLQDAHRIKTTLISQQDAWQQAQGQLDAEQQQRIERLEAERQRLNAQAEELDARQRDLAGQQAKLNLTLAEATTTREHYEERLAKLEEHRSEIESLQDETRKQRRRIAEEFRQERTALHQQLAEAQGLAEKAAADVAELAGGASADHESDATAADWQRKYGLAMDEVRTLRAENKALQSQPAPKSSSPSPVAPPAASGGGFDWEAQKRQMMAESDTSDSGSRQDRQAIEDVIRKTDEIMAAKDREIGRLEQELEELREQTRSMVTDADQLETLVDADDLIQQERAHLEQLKAELQDKLSKAEVTISVERAKIARERVELEEMAVSIKVETKETGKTSEDGKSPRGRWLSRLGLADENEE